MAEVLNPAYGIGYVMPHANGPELYAIGLNYGGHTRTGKAYEEACNVGRWGTIGMRKQVFREGLLRDVYSWNFLTEPQLVRLVGKTSLRKWIGQDVCRGKISRLTDEVSLWEVEAQHIPELRERLKVSGVIFEASKYAKRNS